MNLDGSGGGKKRLTQHACYVVGCYYSAITILPVFRHGSVVVIPRPAMSIADQGSLWPILDSRCHFQEQKGAIGEVSGSTGLSAPDTDARYLGKN